MIIGRTLWTSILLCVMQQCYLLEAWISTMGVALDSPSHATYHFVTQTQCTNSSRSQRTTKLQTIYFVIVTPQVHVKTRKQLLRFVVHYNQIALS